MLIVIWYWLSTQSDCEWDWSTTNFTRHLMRAKKQNLLFVVVLMTWDPTIMGKPKRCVYGLGFGRKRPNPRPSPKKIVKLTWFCHFKRIIEIFSKFQKSETNLLQMNFFEVSQASHRSHLLVKSHFWCFF